MTTQITIDMTATGPVPSQPSALLSQLLAIAMSLSPGLTSNLPGSLIDDISGTDVGALLVMESMAIDLINSVSPFKANEYLLTELGQIYGVKQGQGFNTSVYVVFAGPAGFIVSKGFIVSDGTYQYQVQDGGIINTNGFSDQLYAVAIASGSWAVPAGTVTNLVTSVPSTISLSVTNPSDGIPGSGVQTPDQYRAAVMQAGVAQCTGVPTMVKTLLGNVAGVDPRLISVRQLSTGWEVICGGGDPYQVAYAIFQGMPDISRIVGSTLEVTGISNTNPGIVTTNLNHGYTSGQVINIDGSQGVAGINNTPLTVTVLSEKTFSIGINTTSSGAYTGGGIVTPNLRNISVSINDYPDTYVIPFVNPPRQIVDVALTWNTDSPNYVSAAAVAQLGQPALIDYVNSIAVGQPINLFELQNAFQTAIASVVPPTLLSRMVFVVSINGVVTNPTSGTGLIVGDAESYFFSDVSTVTIAQG